LSIRKFGLSKERGAYTKGSEWRSPFSEEHITSGECPLWVKSRHVRCKKACPLTPESGHNLKANLHSIAYLSLGESAWKERDVRRRPVCRIQKLIGAARSHNNSGRRVIIAAPISGDEEALMAFQPVVLKILEVAAKHNRHITEHLVPGRRGGRLYDRVIIHP
jgi:hypothetical protein